MVGASNSAFGEDTIFEQGALSAAGSQRKVESDHPMNLSALYSPRLHAFCSMESIYISAHRCTRSGDAELSEQWKSMYMFLFCTTFWGRNQDSDVHAIIQIWAWLKAMGVTSRISVDIVSVRMQSCGCILVPFNLWKLSGIRIEWRLIQVSFGMMQTGSKL